MQSRLPIFTLSGHQARHKILAVCAVQDSPEDSMWFRPVLCHSIVVAQQNMEEQRCDKPRKNREPIAQRHQRVRCDLPSCPEFFPNFSMRSRISI